MMRRFLSDTDHIYLACGATDFRKQIPGLAAMVQMQFRLDPYKGSCAFIFCNKKRNGIKILRYDSNGFILASKRLLEDMKFQWPRTPDEVKEISYRQVEWLLQGLEIEQKKAHHEVRADSTPSLVAQVMYQKFALGLPLARQEKDWFRMGLVLPRSDMANWVIRCSEEWLTPVYDRIREKLMECQVLHMDETRIQCNKEEGKKASSDSFMWVIRSAACETVQATFFHYSRSRNGDIAMKLLEQFTGYLVTDGYAGYEKAENITRSLCWSHCRRYFIESIPLDSRGKEISGSKGAEGREYINLLFKVEDEIKCLSPGEKKQKRQDASRPILDAFWSWVDTTSALHTTNELLTKALTYATNQKPYLETFMEDGRLPISNNLCEANIKPFATARRAWLFADTPKGARANAVLYTLVESARINGLDVFAYLRYLLTEMPNNHYLENPEIIDHYLPWSATLPDECRLNNRNKKCLKL